MSAITIKAAAEIMGIKQSWARELLTRRHKERPELGLISRPSGQPTGNIVVDARALREILRGGATQELEELSSRVGMLEADASTTRARVSRLERKAS